MSRHCSFHASDTDACLPCVILLVKHPIDIVSRVVVLDGVEVKDAIPVHLVSWVLELVLLADTAPFDSFRIYDGVLDLRHGL